MGLSNRRKRCDRISACECGAIWPCPFDKSDDHEHPVILEECDSCRNKTGCKSKAPVIKSMGE